MDTVIWIANGLLPLAYLALAFDYGAKFLLRSLPQRRNLAIVPIAVLHAGFLALLGVRSGGIPPATFPELLSVIALSCAIVYAVTEAASRDRRAGVFVFLLVFLVEYASSMFQAATGPRAASESVSGGSQYHVIPASLAYTAMAFAAVYALLYLVGQRGLKRHRLGPLFDRLPPLERLGRMSWYALLVGFTFITLAIVTGAVFAGHNGHTASVMTQPKILAKIITGLVAWAACGAAILGRWFGKWPISRVARIAVVGFMVVVVLFVASVAMS